MRINEEKRSEVSIRPETSTMQDITPIVASPKSLEGQQNQSKKISLNEHEAFSKTTNDSGVIPDICGTTDDSGVVPDVFSINKE